MLDDFIPIIHRLPGRTMRLWALADCHIGAKESDLAGLSKFIKSIADAEDSYLVLVGDILNNCTRSSVSDIWSETMTPSQSIDFTVDLLSPIADRILGCVSGNHERRSVKDTSLDPMYAVVSMLRRSDGTTLQDIYRPYMAFIRLILERGNTKCRYSLMMTHGKSLTKKKQFSIAVEGIDAAIFAHTHTPDITRPAVIRFSESNKVSFHSVVSMTCSSFLKPGGYSLSNLYLPQATSLPQALEFEFTGTNDRKGQVRVVW